MTAESVDFDDVIEARHRIARIALRTTLKPSIEADRYGVRSLHMKMEIMQATGALKVRGAANEILARISHR